MTSTTTLKDQTMMYDPTTVREFRITFKSLRPGVRDRVVIVELDVTSGAGKQEAYEYAIADLAGTRDLDGVAWTESDLLATDAEIVSL